MTLFYSRITESDAEQPFFIFSYCQLHVINFIKKIKLIKYLNYKQLIINFIF